MSSEYNIYNHLENLKNSLYRISSGARETGLFWPRYYYSFFYTQEKVRYNCLLNRQRLLNLPNFTEQEINEYNSIRNNILPSTSYNIISITNKTSEGTSYQEAGLARKNYYLKQCFALGLFAHGYLQLTRFWLIGCFAPALILRYIDSKFLPYDEINNFYKYLIARRDANEMFANNEKKVMESIKNKSNLSVINSQLERTNKSLEEVMNDLNNAYLNAALENKL